MGAHFDAQEVREGRTIIRIQIPADHPASLPFCDSRHQPISSVMGRNSSSRDKRDHANLSYSSTQRRGTASERLPSLVEAVPEIRRTNPAYDNLSHYPRQLHHDPQGPNRYPVNPSLAPSPPNSRSSYPNNSDVPSSSSLRMSISQRRSVGHDGSEMQLPIHSGPPRRNNGSSLSSGYSGSRHHLNPANSMSAPERPPTSNRRSPNSHNLPSMYNVTPGAPSYPPPHSQPAIVAPGISQSNVNYPPSHLHMQRQAEFEAVDIGDKANKKRRGNLPKSTTEILKEWLVQHLDHAYPNEEQKQMLIERTGMSTSQVETPCLTKNTLFANSSFCDGVTEEEKQVSNWFINARRRNVPKMVAQAQAENMVRTNQDRSSQSVSPSTPESTDERARSR